MRLKLLSIFLLLSGVTRTFAIPILLPEDLSRVKASTDITGVAIHARDGRWEIAISASRAAEFSGRALPDGHRFYVDFPDSRLNVGRTLLTLSRDGFTLRASQFSLDPAVVRITVQTESGPPASLTTSSPASRAILTLPMLHPPQPTQIQFTPLPRTVARPSRPRRRVVPSSRSSFTSRGGSVHRPSPEELVFHPDASEAYDDPPVPSDGGSLEPVIEADLPEVLKEGVKRALAGNHRYVWGGETPDGFDCSGMMQFIYRMAKVRLPRTAAEQYTGGSPVENGDLRPGDLLFFSNGQRIFHVGMYIGGGRMFHAANPRRGLTTDLLSSRFYAQHFAGARRFLTP
jgi:hypothetical protein